MAQYEELVLALKHFTAEFQALTDTISELGDYAKELDTKIKQIKELNK